MRALDSPGASTHRAPDPGNHILDRPADAAPRLLPRLLRSVSGHQMGASHRLHILLCSKTSLAEPTSVTYEMAAGTSPFAKQHFDSSSFPSPEAKALLQDPDLPSELVSNPFRVCFLLDAPRMLFGKTGKARTRRQRLS